MLHAIPQNSFLFLPYFLGQVTGWDAFDWKIWIKTLRSGSSHLVFRNGFHIEEGNQLIHLQFPRPAPV